MDFNELGSAVVKVKEETDSDDENSRYNRRTKDATHIPDRVKKDLDEVGKIFTCVFNFTHF